MSHRRTVTAQLKTKHAVLCRSFYDRAPAISVREYNPYVIAEVVVTADSMKDANSEGFRKVISEVTKDLTCTLRVCGVK